MHVLHIALKIALHLSDQLGILGLGVLYNEVILALVGPVGAVEPKVVVVIYLAVDILFDKIAAGDILGRRIRDIYLGGFQRNALHKYVNTVVAAVEIYLDEFALGHVADAVQQQVRLIRHVVADHRRIGVAGDDSVLLGLGYVKQARLLVKLYGIRLLGLMPGGISAPLNRARTAVIAAFELLRSERQRVRGGHVLASVDLRERHLGGYLQLGQRGGGRVNAHGQQFVPSQKHARLRVEGEHLCAVRPVGHGHVFTVIAEEIGVIRVVSPARGKARGQRKRPALVHAQQAVDLGAFQSECRSVVAQSNSVGINGRYRYLAAELRAFGGSRNGRRDAQHHRQQKHAGEYLFQMLHICPPYRLIC